MQEAKKSLVAAIGVVVVIGATIGGTMVRNRMEVGPGVPIGGSVTMDGLVATTKGVPGVAEGVADPVTEATYFYRLTQLLEEEFVDPIKDPEILAIGAVRGMVNSLADSDSLFYKKEQMAALRSRLSGQFEGIGLEVRLSYNQEELLKLQNRSIGAKGAESDIAFDPLLLIPTVVVSTVVPDGPADRAGIKVGDRILRVNDKWALSSIEVDRLRKMRSDFDAGKITNTQLQEWTESFRKRFEAAIAPGKAAEKLVVGTTGSVEIGWVAGDGGERTATIARGVSKLDAVSLRGDVLTLRFFKGAADALAKTDLPDRVTIDLRQSTMGDVEEMRQCLALLVPSGEYGTILREQAGTAMRLSVNKGTSSRRTITLLVDASTWGAAAAFADALASAGLATLEGTPAHDRPWIEVFDLPDGSGYTLRTGTFKAGEASK